MAHVRLAHYTAEEITLILGAIEVTDQLPDGAFFKLSPVEQFGTKEGIGGAVARFKKKKRVAAAELILMNTSEHNQELSAQFALDFESNNGAGVFPAILKDNKGATLAVTEHCWVQKAPDWEVGEEVREVTWQLIWLYDPKIVIFGGN